MVRIHIVTPTLKNHEYLRIGAENGSITATHNYALYLFSEKKYDDAEKYFKIAIDKNHSESYNALGILCLETKKYDDAEKYLLKAIELNVIDAYIHLVSLYTKLNVRDKIIQYGLKYLELRNGQYENDGKHKQFLINISYAYIYSDNYNDALIYALKCVELGGIGANYQVGVCYMFLKDYENAIKHLTISHIGGNPNTSALAKCYFDIGDNENAYKYYKVVYDGGNHTFIHLMYVCCMRMKKTDEIREKIKTHLNEIFNENNEDGFIVIRDEINNIGIKYFNQVKNTVDITKFVEFTKTIKTTNKEILFEIRLLQLGFTHTIFVGKP